MPAAPAHNGQMNSTRKQISTAKAPAAIGPYSQAIVAGSWVFTSGQIGLDPATGEMVEGGVEAQAEQVFRNLGAVLEEAGCSLADVVKTTVYLADMNAFSIVNAVYARSLGIQGAAPPARSTVQAARLPRDAQVEIEAIALRQG